MDFTVITAPNQMKLIEDILFDVTGVPVSAGELVTMTLAVIAIKLIFQSPLLKRA